MTTLSKGYGLAFVLGVLTLAVASQSAGLATVAHSAVDADRSTGVDVVDNESGILSINGSAEVTASESGQRLVSVENPIRTGQNVTVRLGDDVATWTLSNGDRERTVGLSHSETEVFTVDVGDVPEQNGTYYVNSTTGNFWFSQRKSVHIVSPPQPLVESEVTSSALQVVTDNRSEKTLTKAGDVIGPAASDYDDDGRKEFPYSSGSGNIYLLDKSGESTKIVGKGARNPPSVYWFGRWNGSGLAVFYSNESSGGDQDIFYATTNGTTVRAVKTKAKPIAGAADIDGDGQRELVFGGGSQTVKYVEPDGTVKTTGQGFGANQGTGIGEPADFDGDGVARIPVVDGSNNLLLVTANGSTTTIVSGGVEKTTPAPYDWDDDGTPELMYVTKTDHYLKYADYENGTWTTDAAHTAGGVQITVGPETGVA